MSTQELQRQERILKISPPRIETTEQETTYTFNKTQFWDFVDKIITAARMDSKF